MEALEKFFNLKEVGSDVKTEVVAGLTSFFTMAYILAVNPGILSATGMDKGALFTATALSACVATLVMALVARLPFVLAPGMGLNAFFAFAVVLGMGYSWQFALTAVFLEGIIFILLTFLNIREAIIASIPLNLKRAITVGIGLFIAHIGFQGAGIVVDHPATLVTVGNLTSAKVVIALIGLIVAGYLLAKNTKGAILAAIFVSTFLAVILTFVDPKYGQEIWGYPMSMSGFSPVAVPHSLEPIFWKFEFDKVLSLEMLTVLFTFLFVDMFDTVGTLIGVTTKAGILNKDGSIPRCKQALLADAIGTTFGAICGTSTVTTYVESAAGVEEGGKTGLTALTAAIMFAVSLVFAPLFLLIPGAATAPAMILVGLFMTTPVLEIDFKDFTEAIPAFLCFMLMPLTYEPSEGIIFGVVSWTILKAITGKSKEISPLTWFLTAIFILKVVMH